MATKNFYILFSILMSMFGTKALAYDIAVKNADGVTIYYNYINDGTELSVTYETNKFNCYSGVVAIPEEVTYMKRTRKVTSIGESAFRSCTDLTSVTIPNSVTSIGYYAFCNSLKLTTITIPNSVTIIKSSAFESCRGLTTVTIGNSVTTIGLQAFFDCRALTSITIPNSVTTIEESAFKNCYYITSVTIGNSVTSIGNNAFRECYDITSVTIPNSVTSLGEYAFYNCTDLISVTMGNSVTSIGEYTFYNCHSLTSINIPNSVTSIGKFAFAECRVLPSVIIPNNVKSIGTSAFEECNELASVTIGSSVRSIGEKAFAGCDIPDVISKIGTPFDIDKNTFSDNTFYNATLYVPEGTIDKYKAKEGWKRFLFFEEGNGGGDTPTDPHKCEKPIISYQNGKLMFSCATDGVEFKYHVTFSNDDLDGSANELKLSKEVTAQISVVAKKEGYLDSEPATKDIILTLGVKGDVNLDGVVNITDAVNVVDIILNGDAK